MFRDGRYAQTAARRKAINNESSPSLLARFQKHTAGGGCCLGGGASHYIAGKKMLNFGGDFLPNNAFQSLKERCFCSQRQCSSPWADTLLNPAPSGQCRYAWTTRTKNNRLSFLGLLGFLGFPSKLCFGWKN